MSLASRPDQDQSVFWRHAWVESAALRHHYPSYGLCFPFESFRRFGITLRYPFGPATFVASLASVGRRPNLISVNTNAVIDPSGAAVRACHGRLGLALYHDSVHGRKLLWIESEIRSCSGAVLQQPREHT